RLLRGRIATMTSSEDVRRLHRQGLSVRQIAARLGLSRSAVHRRIVAAGPPEEYEPGDPGDPFGSGGRMTGQATVYRTPGRDRNGDPVDANGNPVSMYSAATYLGTLDVVLNDAQAMSVEPGLTGSGGGNVDRSETADVVSQVGAPRHAEILLRHG